MAEESPFRSHELNQAIFTTVGQLAVNWALMEFSLDALVSVIFHDFEGRKVEPELPRELSRKVRFVRSFLATSPEVVHTIKDDLLKEMDRLSNLREPLINRYLY